MLEILDKIRKPSIFILLLILNLRFLFSLALGDRQEILSALTIPFFLLSFDYQAIRREHLYWLLLFIGIALLDITPIRINTLTPLILMQCISRLDIRTYLRYNIIILGGTVAVMFLIFGTGNMSVMSGIDSILVRTRYDFGFGHANIAAAYYWGLFISVMLYTFTSRYRNFLWVVWGGLFIIGAILYSETLSRSFSIVMIMFTLVFAYYTLRSKFTENYKIGFSKYILYVLPLFLTGLTIYLGINAEDFPKLNILFSGRLSLYKGLLESLTPVQFLIGTRAVSSMVIDNSYLHLLFELGVFLFIYFIWLYFFAIKNIIRQQNYLIIAIFVSFMVYGLMESLLLFSLVIGNNLVWVLLYRYRYGEDEELNPRKEDKEEEYT